MRDKCRVCGRPLTDPESILIGMGPVCAGKSSGKREKSLFTDDNFDHRVLGNNVLFINDLSGELGGMSVTNKAEKVLEQISQERGKLTQFARIIYRDTTGKIDELVVDENGLFKDFKFLTQEEIKDLTGGTHASHRNS
jgi:hypothetical protein